MTLPALSISRLHLSHNVQGSSITSGHCRQLWAFQPEVGFLQYPSLDLGRHWRVVCSSLTYETGRKVSERESDWKTKQVREDLPVSYA